MLTLIEIPKSHLKLIQICKATTGRVPITPRATPISNILSGIAFANPKVPNQKIPVDNRILTKKHKHKKIYFVKKIFFLEIWSANKAENCFISASLWISSPTKTPINNGIIKDSHILNHVLIRFIRTIPLCVQI